MAYRVGVVCSPGVGPERGGRELNEDNYLICQAGRASWRVGDREQFEAANGAGVLLAVADGMGGMEGGEMASTVAVRVMAKLYAAGRPKDAETALRHYVHDAHGKLHAQIAATGKRVRMGTTLSLAWLLGGRLAWAHVGDSRIYLYRDGELRRLTIDHTSREFARRDGRRAEAYPEDLAQNFIFGSRGIGTDAEIRVDAGKDTGTEVLIRGDRVLLCTDGLWGAVDDASIADVLLHVADPQAAAVACMERALARGGRDNVTVLVIGVDDPTFP